ncbi:hypothetical protein FB45DRAFT_517150 [Roridomyces roridus]|uniref:Uncharacterized protein n=1 Tax=Roridomyces roridus TaxID=1738132 RepID=A0AAD7BX21_9AGAR|nr:hypothetical protein FB45DRAFT_517150 [Roridomyces roridus]
MSSPALSSTSGPPLYRYIVISAAVLIAIIFVAVGVRSRLYSRHARRLRRVLGTEDDDEAGAGGGGIGGIGGREPRLFDAYLHDGGASQWEDMMPLSAENLGAPEGWVIPAEKQQQQEELGTAPGLNTMRVNVGVIVRMPVPVPLSQLEHDQEEDSEPPPYVELGVVEMLRPVV